MLQKVFLAGLHNKQVSLGETMKRILILTADYGYGHRSAAKAIAQALQETYGNDCQVEIINPMDHPHASALLRDGTNGYDKLVREAPDLYKLGYEVGDTQVISSFVKSGLTVMLFNALREIIHQKRPDVIVCTHSPSGRPMFSTHANCL
jgi:UDP-N-acetylglucosamine:LPS N-acetylglucosamine transferase